MAKKTKRNFGLKVIIVLIILVLVGLFYWLTKNIFFNQSSGQKLFSAAQELKNQKEYSLAAQAFDQARIALKKEGKISESEQARINNYQMGRISVIYPYTHEEMVNEFQKTFPDISIETLNQWEAEDRIDKIAMGPEDRYYMDFTKNIYYRNLPLMREAMKKANKSVGFLVDARPYFANYKALSSIPSGRSIQINANANINILRKDLPEQGLFKAWVPLPIETDVQKNIIVNITPDEYVKKVETTGDIGYAYLEIPLDTLTNDLAITAQISITRYEKRVVVNPDNIGTYDKNSDLYKKFTRNSKNINITDEIRKKAKSIVGEETNPYIIAQKVYDYVVNNIFYSSAPHMYLDVIGIAESDFVHEKQWGDCGAQSKYFVTLMRSLGIPARTPGGYQVFPGEEGTHVWAEYYLPEYGWVPIDVTVAEAADWSDVNTTAEEKAQFKEYYFGNLEPFRYTIQNDSDLEITPKPNDPPADSAIFQNPIFDCPLCESDLNLRAAADEIWQLKLTGSK